MKTITFKELNQKKEKIMDELFGKALSKHYTYLGNLSNNKFHNIDGEMTISIRDMLQILEKHLGNIKEQPLLTNKETAYLKAIIEPFKEEVESIYKYYSELIIEGLDGYYIARLHILDSDYKGLKLEARYSLKDLDLE